MTDISDQVEGIAVPAKSEESRLLNQIRPEWVIAVLQLLTTIIIAVFVFGQNDRISIATSKMLTEQNSRNMLLDAVARRSVVMRELALKVDSNNKNTTAIAADPCGGFEGEVNMLDCYSGIMAAYSAYLSNPKSLLSAGLPRMILELSLKFEDSETQCKALTGDAVFAGLCEKIVDAKSYRKCHDILKYHGETSYQTDCIINPLNDFSAL